MYKFKSKILITGATGFLGSHLLPIVNGLYGVSNVVAISSKNYDLLNEKKIEEMFEFHKPHTVIHLAAYSGGIGANQRYPADFFYKNSLFVNFMFEYASRFNVQKLIYTMGGCSYPANVKSPILEDKMWDGYPQKESSGYSVAKKMGLVASDVYRAQYGLNSCVLIPGNMYGEFDNFDLDNSHVVPGMIRKFFEANQKNIQEIEMWGDGSPIRDFVYAGDVAKCITWFIENYNSSDPINISSGRKTVIKDLAIKLASIQKYKGRIKWDTSRPNGQKIKIFDVTKLKSFGISCDTNLDDGLYKTTNWFNNNYHSNLIRL